MERIIKIILFSCIILIIDYIWITNIMSNIYKKIFINEIKINIFSVIVAYLCMIIGFFIFVENNDNKINKFGLSFIFGVITFGIYGFTLSGILDKKFPIEVALLETIWGGILFSSSYFISTQIIQLIH